ncbi:TonB-dependent receptor [uncultured Shewanella sp.]|uniref:TonB-dependent receptor n=1 Tax=uncultured Shewanella sp. TaxID=173975 RepID=UPI002614EE11|nr:TonB-dependent receptor [uncultured Shewanella sp.]
MIRYLIASLFALTCHGVMANEFSLEPDTKPAPVMAVTLDYIPAAEDMYGVTFAPRHYDRDYADWGYYIGYAQSKKEDVYLEPPGEAYTQDTLWRFGVSYSLTTDFSLYGGATAYTTEYSSTTNIVPYVVGAEPVWETDKDTTWGAEVGLRYVIGKHFMIGAGYNSATESAVLSIGYSM